jgi:5,10-methylenetetrahydromethanopterin reductase
MEISAAFPPGRDLIDYAALAESLGYRRVWVYDSPALYEDVFVALSQLAEHTDDIGLGAAVLVPSLRHVLVTAAAISSLEAQAPGRLAVAIGTGFTGRRMLGQKPLAWARVERYVRELRGLLAGETVEVDGAKIALCGPEGFGARRPIRTPILIAANGPKGLAVARALGDGVMCVREPQPGFAWCAALAFGTVMEPGESFTTPRVRDALGPAIAVIYHGTYEASPAAVDNLPGGAAWRAEVEKIPEDVRHLAVHEGHLVEVSALDRRHIAPELGALTLSGTEEQLRERLKQLEAAGLTEILYQPCGPDIPRELEAFAEMARS